MAQVGVEYLENTFELYMALDSVVLETDIVVVDEAKSRNNQNL